MIPLKIQIKNFLSYGPETQTIDFQNYNLICLSGKNGHGKSALLDAITWALWGQARKTGSTSKADQGLVHLGQHSMTITFDFLCNNTQYRIKREYHHHYGKPYSVLEFGSVDNQSGQEHAFTDKTIKATQDTIEKIIRISYDAFVNSAFLKQGQSNEFSQKSPKDRKEILASILGLELYETLRKRALEKSKIASLTKTHMTAVQEKLGIDIQNKDALIKESQGIKQQTLELARQDADIKEQLKQAYARKDILGKQSEIMAADTRSHTLLQNQKDDFLLTIKQLRTNWHQARSSISTALSMHDLEKRKQDLNAELAVLNTQTVTLLEKKQAIIDLNVKKTNLETKLREEIFTLLDKKRASVSKVSNEYTIAQTHLQKLQNARQQTNRELVEKAATLAKVTLELEALTKTVNQETGQERQIERKKEFCQKFITLGSGLKAEYLEIEKKESMSLSEEDPSCPLCEQNLSAARRRFLKQKLFDRKARLMHWMKRLSIVVKKLKHDLETAQITAQERQKRKELYYQLVSRHEMFTQQQTALDQQINTLDKQHESLSQELLILQTAVGIQQKELLECETACEQSLKNNTELQELVRAIEHNAQETRSLEHITHAQKNHLAELAKIHEQLEAYKIALSKKDSAHEIKRECVAVCKKVKELKVQLAALSEKIDQKKNLEKQLQEIAGAIDTLNATSAQVQSERERLLEKLGTADATIAKILTAEKEYFEYKEKLTSLEREIADHTLLSNALGKEGIQALMIEEVIPEIEQEANYLLAKLTDNQSHISIDSLRDLKKGGSKETLDIKISDSVGIRPYEMFSGGEAFRIDFALRIAISKLLARRAGTALQTLIIDEGFGSQDEEGLNNIMEAIHKIQEDFAKIIIVSHLPNMKDQFPVHFVIEKGSQGSMVKVVENE